LTFPKKASVASVSLDRPRAHAASASAISSVAPGLSGMNAHISTGSSRNWNR